jgi:para-nitrobenzyl esterase
VHASGFSGGKRNDKNTVGFAKAVAAISYRLTRKKLGFGCATKSEDKIIAFNKASKDLSAAVPYLLNKTQNLE